VASVFKEWVWLKGVHVLAFYQLLECVKNKRSLFNALFLVLLGFLLMGFDFSLYILTGFYSDWMFVLFYTGLGWLLVLGMGLLLRMKPGDVLYLLGNSALITLAYSLVYLYYWLAVKYIYASLEGSHALRLVFVYLVPLLELVPELAVRVALRLSHHNLRPFLAQTYWMVYGFRAGILSRVYFGSPEYYYLVLVIGCKDIALTWLLEKPWLFLHVHDANFSINFWPLVYLLMLVYQHNPVATAFQVSLAGPGCSLTFDWRRPFITPQTKLAPGTQAGTNASMLQYWVTAGVALAGWAVGRKYRLDAISPLYFLYFVFGIYLFAQGMTAATLLETRLF
jgi:hypothetical protein